VRRRNPVPLLVFLAGVVAVALGAWVFAKRDMPRTDAARQVLEAPSEIRYSMTVDHVGGPIAEEEYRMDDLSGASTSEYRAVGRSGTAIKVSTLPHETTDVVFLFEKLVQDGIWELSSKPPRGDTSVRYTVEIYQLVNGKHGSHRFTFTDPHYWATTGGHQYHIHLDRSKPVPNLLTMSSTVLVEPRYQEIVDAFRKSGTDTFRAKVAAAQARLGAKT
jgi:hypothetical protein